jgi:electron transfer flavoprotein beta subunit
MPVLLTVVREAAEPRPWSAARTLIFRNARALWEIEASERTDVTQRTADLAARGLLIPTLGADDLDVDPSRCGLAGSPTKVHRVAAVVLDRAGRQRVEPTREGLRALLAELRETRILG